MVQFFVQMKVQLALGVVQKMVQIALGVVQKTLQIALGVVQKNGANCLNGANEVALCTCFLHLHGAKSGANEVQVAHVLHLHGYKRGAICTCFCTCMVHMRCTLHTVLHLDGVRGGGHEVQIARVFALAGASS